LRGVPPCGSVKDRRLTIERIERAPLARIGMMNAEAFNINAPGDADEMEIPRSPPPTAQILSSD
jgi:hypothetical protein